MRTPCLSVLLTVTLLGADQVTPQQFGTASAAAEATVEGQVVKAASGEPLKNAWVVLQKMDGARESYRTVTGDDGRYRLTVPEPARCRVWAGRNGYVTQEYGQRITGQQGTTLSLRPGRQLRQLDFRLSPAGIIAGHVYNEDGEPMPYVMVQAMRFQYRQGRREARPVAFAQTNDLGEYRLFGLPPGRYYLSASLGRVMLGYFDEAQGAAMWGRGSGPDEAYAPTYYAGTSDPARATGLDLRTGEELTGIDFTFVPTTGVRVRGRIMNAVTGEPGRNTQYMLLPRDSRLRGVFGRNSGIVQDPLGSFEIRNVTPGSYMLLASFYDQGKTYSASETVEVGYSDVEGISLVVAPGTELRGRVRVEGDTKLDLTELTVALRPESDIPFPSPYGRPKDDGGFVLDNVTANSYRLVLFGLRDDFYLKAATLAGNNVLDDGLDFTGGRSRGSLELVVSSRGGLVEGIVVNDRQERLPGTRIVLIPDSPRRGRSELYKTATTDQGGRFTLRGVTPGDYKLFAWEILEEGAYEDPDFLRPYENRGKAHSVQEGGRYPVQLEVIPAGERLP